MDSTVLAYYMREKGFDLKLLSFDYGQRHKKELDFAKWTAVSLDVEHYIVDITNITHLISNSALTNPSIPVPEGHYTAESMKATVVPNRNAIMLSIAYGYAVSISAQGLVCGVHAGDHAIYPDCRPMSIEMLDSAFWHCNEGFGSPDLRLQAPFVTKTKADIVAIGYALKVPFEHTWSCYNGDTVHCGLCGTCVERREAFDLAGVTDPTIYRAQGLSRGLELEITDDDIPF
jgi:7-cyano-7-deazaguanine synthase